MNIEAWKHGQEILAQRRREQAIAQTGQDVFKSHLAEFMPSDAIVIPTVADVMAANYQAIQHDYRVLRTCLVAIVERVPPSEAMSVAAIALASLKLPAETLHLVKEEIPDLATGKIAVERLASAWQSNPAAFALSILESMAVEYYPSGHECASH